MNDKFSNPYENIRLSPMSGRYCVVYCRHQDFETLEAAQAWRDANPNNQPKDKAPND